MESAQPANEPQWPDENSVVPASAASSSAAPVRSSSDPTPLGQWLLSMPVPRSPTTKPRLMYSLLVCGLFDTGERFAQACAASPRQSTKEQLCPVCKTRLGARESKRPWFGQQAHQRCVKSKKQAPAFPQRSFSAPAATLLPQETGRKLFSVRLKRKPFEALGPTQRRERVSQAREMLEAVDVPVQALHRPLPAPEELLHLSQSDRQRIRTVPSLPIPSEHSVRAAKQAAAHTHSTETASFDTGAYVTDPLHFIRMVVGDSPLLVVGGDTGGNFLKLGVTYTANEKQTFAALLVYKGADDWETMDKLRRPGLTPFAGTSADCAHIFAVLQQLIDRRGAFLNGDWKFINAVLGIKAPGATHPCPSCCVSTSNLASTAPQHRRLRSASDLPRCTIREPLLSIPPERIVPTPLHVFLGLGNRLIFRAFTALAGEEAVVASVQAVKTVHTAGSGGLSDLHQLNGPELTRWMQRTTTASLLPAPSAVQRSRCAMLLQWMQRLHSALLSASIWTPAAIDDWRSAVVHILREWTAETGDHAFPKLHMLTHSYEFMERHRILGRASEAQLESYHAAFNRLYERHHHNQAANTAERARRALADTTLVAAQPALTAAARKRNTG